MSKLVISIRVCRISIFIKGDIIYLLENKLCSTLPRAVYSYISTLCSSSQQYPINFTRFGCESCPKNMTSA
uniref:Uncharacterized protein n=1 Tax=Lotus japonicus TaxID=34305 RepID=I3SJ77_LOTJA|nr:unknown [Lotus japonicus]